MKVKKDSINIANKKKNALPSSKLLKPKKFKTSLKKSKDASKPLISKDTLKLVKEDTNIQLHKHPELIPKGKLAKKSKLKNSLGLVKIPIEQSSPSNLKNSKNESNKKNISTLFDFVKSDKPNNEEKITENGVKISSKGKPNRHSKHISSEGQSFKANDKEVRTESNKRKLRPSTVLTSQNETEKLKVHDSHKVKVLTNRQYKTKKSLKKQKLTKLENKDQTQKNEAAGIDNCKLKEDKVVAITEGLLKLINETSSSKTEFLDVGEPVYLQVECIKIPICPTKQLRFKIPHSLTDETCDVLLITADLKGHKIYPDRAIDHYEELLTKHQINFITKVMPIRMVKKEYSQYEMKRKLADQFDVILADSRIVKSLPAVLGKFVLYKRKMPIPVNLMIGEHKLKKHLQEAVSKTQMSVKSNGHSSIVQVGHSKMSAKEIAANIVEVAKSLEILYPGGWKNIRSLVVKSAKSTSLPIYLSLLSPNQVRIPIETRKKPPPVEDELSTMPNHRVIVTADGNVILKKIEEDSKIDDSRDDEILEEAKKYMESSKTVRYDESSDEEKNEEKEDSESDNEGDTITEAMEKKLLNKYEKNAKVKKSKEGNEEERSEEEEEEDGDMEDETKLVPMIGKKRKGKGAIKQSSSPSKKQKGPVELKKNKKDNSIDSNKGAASGFKKPQTRGTRGGKKNKMSKDQRKALIKRKKAGKK